MKKQSRIGLICWLTLAALTSGGMAASCSGSNQAAAESALTPSISAPQQEVPTLTTRNRPTERVDFSHLTIDDGLSQNTITSIVQDEYGFIWIGTLDGLNKFDGYHFSIYRHDPDRRNSLSGNMINDLLVDQEGAVWIATSSGLNRYDRSIDGFQHFVHDPDDPGSLSSDETLALFESSRHHLWVGTSSGLNRFDPINASFEKFQHDPQRPGTLIDDRVQVINESPAGFLWLGTPEGLDELNLDQLTFDHFTFDLIDRYSISNPDVRDLDVDSTGRLWIATYGGGINWWIPEFRRFEYFQHQPNFPWSLTDNRVHSLVIDSSGLVWIATESGLDILEPGQERFIHLKHDPLNPRSLSANSIRSLYEDTGGVLWAGTTGSGLNLYDSYSKAFEHVRYDPSQRLGLPDNNVLAITEDSQQVLWVGTDRGLTGFNPRTGAVIRYEHNPINPSSIAGDNVRALFEDHDGSLWVGTLNGLDRLERRTGSFRHFSSNPDLSSTLSSNAVTVIKEDAWGLLWVGTAEGLNRLDVETQQFTRIYLDPLETHSKTNHVADLVIAADGLIWVATSGGGLFQINRSGDVLKHYEHEPLNPNSLSHSTLISMSLDDGKILWIGSTEGLNRLDLKSGQFTRLRTSDGLPNDTINCVLQDSKQNLWISTNRGLASVGPDLESIRSYTLHDGIQSNEFLHACEKAKDGTLYFGGVNGYNAFHPEEIQDNPNPPSIALTGLTQGGELIAKDRAVEDEQSITLTWPDTFFEFEFAALSYPQPLANLYAYRLNGFDHGWIEIGTRRFGRYTNLPAGDYTLELKGSNHDGVWSQPMQALTIRVVPPFWQTWIFRIGSSALAVLMVVVGYRLRVRSVENRSRELEQQVTSRTHEIEQRRQQLEALFRADEEMYRHLELNSVLRALAGVAVEILQADKSAVWVWDQAHEQLELHVSCGLGSTNGWPPVLDPDEVEIARARRSGEPIVIEEIRSSANFANSSTALGRKIIAEGIAACMHLPIWVDQQFFALFSVCYSRKHHFSLDDRRLYEALVKRAVVAIENARLYKQTQEIAVLEERNRLARELHDAVTQTLFSASLIAEALPDLWEQDPSEGESLLQELRSLSRGALAEMRSLLLELRPTALIETPLEDLLHQLAEAAFSKQGVPIQVIADGECHLPGDIHLTLYRIAQEALNNAVKHGQASQVVISLHCEGGSPQHAATVHLTIEDDGHGFEPALVPPDRLGLKILAERAQAIEAQIQVKSEINVGTRIDIHWKEVRDGNP